MTNEMIIFIKSQELAEAGIIGYTGRTFKGVDGAGNEVEYKETEEIHTFNAWKELGYKVKKGEHNVAQFTIWKYSPKKSETMPMQDGENVEVPAKGRMFMKMASFFKRSQVEPIKA